MKRQIILVISLVCGLVAALLTRTYLTVKENEIKAERAKLLKQYGTIKVVTFARDVPSGAVLSEADLALRFAPEICIFQSDLGKIQVKMGKSGRLRV
jgi:Flp pilus assembly protein CpaB